MSDSGGDLDSDDEAPSLVPLPPPSFATSPLSPSSPPPTLPPCPVAVLAGFLGSGKSTLINYILKAPHGKRIAVIENEYGEGLSVESLIARDGVDNSSLSDFIELPNGCICCTVKDSLVSTLENLVTAKRDDLDYILIECSGLANPGPIASVFWLDEALESRLRLDAIITLVDAKNIDMQLRQTVEAAQQIAYADRILLNKTDLVDSTELILKTIQKINPTAPCRMTQYSKVDLDWILDAKCLDSDRIKEIQQMIESFEVVASNDSDENHFHDHDHDHLCSACHPSDSHHSHTESISTIFLSQSGSVNLKLLNQWLASILWPNQDEQDKVLRFLVEANEPGAFDALKSRESSGPQIYRIKGIVSVFFHEKEDDEYYSEEHVDGATGIDSRQYLVQGVHDLWTVHPSSSSFEVEAKRQCQLVVIGQRLDIESLQAGFRSCFI